MSGDVRHENKALMGIFVGLLVLIVVLAGVIVGVNVINANNGAGNDESEELMEAIEILPEIERRTLEEPDFDTDDAIALFEEERQKGDDNRKFLVNLDYAFYKNNYLLDVYGAIEILESIKPLISNDDEFVSYCGLAIEYYRAIGKEEEINECLERLTIKPDGYVEGNSEEG
ncbi:hypothetical protein IKD98_03375 [Candidatus Saccharibacteria bacterium]|nr:hypothetical protein [Candidatus Saccharibacteria bacterium]